MSFFKNPLKSGDKDLGVVGDVVMSQTATLVFGNASKVVFKLPRPYQVLDIDVDVLTPFNAATTNTLDLGVPGDTDRFTAALALGVAGRVRASSDVSQLIDYVDNTDDGGATDVIATYNQSGAAASAGSARLTLTYVMTKTPSV